MKNPFSRPSAPPRPVRRAPAPEGDDEAPAGCGWFDSSHVLHQGLVVRELQAPGELARVVPLGWWLDWAVHGE
jgi:hypothetical protein